MKYYVTADVHGYYTLLREELEKAGYFREEGPHKLLILGDLLDRGDEASEMQDFILGLMEWDQVILGRGNHEDLFVQMVNEDAGLPVRHHVSNGTYGTALQLTQFDADTAQARNLEFAERARETLYYQRIIPATIDYYETDRYVFVHGWIPCQRNDSIYEYNPDWRNAGPEEWKKARWYHGIDAVQTCGEKKTILCGHWHASYGHAIYEHVGSEFGEDADFSPYYAPGIIALDACTAVSGRVNVVVMEDSRETV